MDTFRLILFLIGTIIVIIIYLFARKASGKPFVVPSKLVKTSKKFTKEPETEEEIAGSIREKRYASDTPDDDYISQISQALSPSAQKKFAEDEIESVPPMIDEGEVEPLLIVMTIMAKKGNLFNGMDILDAALANGFVHGEMNIFHYYPEQQTNRAVCSLANAVEPGYFAMDKIEQIQTPGLTMFMQLPGPIESREAFEKTVKLGRSLAEQLQGDLCDESRSVLTMQTIEHLKEKVEAHIFKARMNQIKQHRH